MPGRGERRHVIKLVFLPAAFRNLSLEEFRRYWLEARPAACGARETLRIKRYVQVHTLGSPANEAMWRSRDASEPYDGVAELGGQTKEMAGAHRMRRDAARELLEDERKFVDLQRSALWIGTEHTIVD
jgi:hypothetical protein